MATRSLNKVQLIGNLTRDPELRYTPQGTAVCTLGLATNRTWTTDAGEKKEDVEFHRLVAWNKLAELCAQLLFKGRRVYVEGRLQTRSWTAPDGAMRQVTEVVISDMLILDSRRQPEEGAGAEEVTPAVEETPAEVETKGAAAQATEPALPPTQATTAKTKKKQDEGEEKEKDLTAEDIPF